MSANIRAMLKEQIAALRMSRDTLDAQIDRAEEILALLDEQAPDVAAEALAPAPKPGPKPPEVDIAALRLKVQQAFREDDGGPLLTRQVADRTGLPLRTAGDFLQQLHVLGVVSRDGFGRSTRWALRGSSPAPPVVMPNAITKKEEEPATPALRLVPQPQGSARRRLPTVEMRTIKIEAISSLDDKFFCKPLGGSLTAKLCTEQQEVAKASIPVNFPSESADAVEKLKVLKGKYAPTCANCMVGEQVKRRLS